MKADLKQYKNYTILFNSHESGAGSFCPIATLFKSGEEAFTLDIKRSFKDRDQALSFALGASEETINAILEGKETDFAINNFSKS